MKLKELLFETKLSEIKLLDVVEKVYDIISEEELIRVRPDFNPRDEELVVDDKDEPIKLSKLGLTKDTASQVLDYMVGGELTVYFDDYEEEEDQLKMYKYKIDGDTVILYFDYDEYFYEALQQEISDYAMEDPRTEPEDMPGAER